MKTVTVFCSSSQQVSPMFFSEMQILARGLASRGWKVVYGGAQVGLMGHLADEVLKAGGQIEGVIPEFLDQPEITHQNLTRLEVVGDMMDRKKRLLELGDAAIVFPGGVGTLDEATEAISLKQLGQYTRPIVFVNFMGFFQSLDVVFREWVEQKMIMQPLESLYTMVESAEKTLEFLEDSMTSALKE
jgi:uncharacterized protein (TIGR00730 family)